MKNSTYERLYRKISQDIVSGKLKPGARLPSIRSLADQEGISCNTVIGAYNLLLSEGFIDSKEKSGYYVAHFEHNSNRPEATDRPRPRPAKQNITEQQESDDLNLSANLVDSSLFPYATLRQLYREALTGKNISLLETRGSYNGDFELRDAIASFLYSSRGIKCNSDQVVIGNGTSFHLQRLAMMFGKKALFLMEDPGYSSNSRIITDMGCPVRYVPLDDSGVVIEDLRTITKEKDEDCQLLHISPSHQFPMGCTMSAPRRQSVLNWASESQSRFIVEDDYDSDFRYIGHPVPALQSLDGDKVIYIGTFSRTLTPSMRISYMILPEKLLKSYERRFSFYPCPVSRTDQKVVSMFITQGYYQRHINRMKRIYRQRRDFMTSLLEQSFPRMEIKGQQAGLHFIFKPEKDFDDEDAAKAVSQASSYNMKLSATQNGWLVIGWAHLSEDEMARAAQILRQVCRTNR